MTQNDSNREQIAKLAAYLCQAYSQDLTASLIEIMIHDFKDIPPEDLWEFVERHRAHPVRGQFFPKLADINYQRFGGPDWVQAEAEKEFNQNPGCDGTGSWELQRESYYERDRRKKRYLQASAVEWSEAVASGEAGWICQPGGLTKNQQLVIESEKAAGLEVLH